MGIPISSFQTLLQGAGRNMFRKFFLKPLPCVGIERTDPDVLLSFSRCLGTESAATDAGAQPRPIGSGKAMTREPGTIDKRLNQKRPDPITRLPIVGQARQNQTEHFGSKVGAVNLLPYQKPGEAYNFLQMPEASIGAPPDPTVAGAETKCRRSESQCTQPPMRTVNKISHLRAERGH